jgi:hypothetical protein
MDLEGSVEACSLSVLRLINVVNLPFLTQLVCQSVDRNESTFLISVVGDLKYFTVLDVPEVVLGVLELLVPLSVGRLKDHSA